VVLGPSGRVRPQTAAGSEADPGAAPETNVLGPQTDAERAAKTTVKAHSVPRRPNRERLALPSPERAYCGPTRAPPETRTATLRHRRCGPLNGR